MTTAPEPQSPWRARISSSRPMEAILFERTMPEGQVVLTALVDRRTGELTFVGEAVGLAPSEVEELRGHARGGDTEGLAPIEMEQARLRLSRALLASRIAGRPAPRWLQERADLVGDPTHPASRIEDIYLCEDCDAPLPVRWQLARVHLHPTDQAAPLKCPLCRGVEVPAASLAEIWQDRAWLMLAADLPHRALVCAARAEAERAPHGRLDIVRGLAHLRLEQGAQALKFFERAAFASGHKDARLEAWVMRARELVQKTTPARTAQHRDLTVPAPTAGHGSMRVIAPVPAHV